MGKIVSVIPPEMEKPTKKSVVVLLSDADKRLIEDAAYKSRTRTATWARSVLVHIAQQQLGVTKC